MQVGKLSVRNGPVEIWAVALWLGPHRRCLIDVRAMLDRCSKDVRFCMTCELSFALPTNLNSWISALMDFCMTTFACLGLSAFPSVFISVGIRPRSCGSVYQHLRGPSESVEVNRLESVGGIRAGIAKR